MRLLLRIVSRLADVFGSLQWWCFGMAARITDRMVPDADSRHAWENFQQLTRRSEEESLDGSNGREA